MTVTGRNDTTAMVEFDISWENSWRYTNINHDAAWVFFKVLPDGRTDWERVTLEGTGTNPTDYVVGAGTPIEMIVPADRVGMFVRRSGEGAGTTSVQNVKAVWNIASNSLVKTDKVKLQAFGVEMVYVAEGAFKVGDGSSDQGQLYEGGGGTTPFAITNAGPISCSNLVGCLWGASQSGNTSMGGVGTISSNYPNGYNAFYSMKYELTQGQYADFLNTLTRDQQATRCTATTLDYYMSATAGGSAAIQNRNTVRLTEDPGSPSRRVYTTVTRDRACNWLSWADGAAFADWAGLRPMSELEFEKACRGPLDPVADEYAFGVSAYTVISGLQGTDGSGTEYYTAGNLIVSGSNPGGPVRVGIFATALSTRVSAGASYWGIMELSGNVWERPVTIGNATGRAFTGLHGNGVLNAAGDADVTAWPNTTATGAGFRGGSWYNASAHARVSDRIFAAIVLAVRNDSSGSRAGRSAPSGVGP
ncbi:MAG: hypothetical protein A3K19_05205 [Lentisphaerae bacterium RIFOXYB12_FULL_65_16]|nr:MAG: hypothetical protein A3K19_05205 [Lentisphaerae bacterium RIFOXYB12_FULL_65_16]